MTTQAVSTRGGLQLVAETRRQPDAVEVTLQVPAAAGCVLHWGLRRPAQPGWSLPPAPAWPPGTVAAGPGALETPFTKTNGQANLVIHLPPAEDYSALEFVLFFPGDKRWDNNGGRNYQIPLAEPPLDMLRARAQGEDLVLERVFDLPEGGQLAAGVTRVGEGYRLRLVANRGGELVLHWGLAHKAPQEWLLPPESCRPANTTVYQERAAETPFTRQEGAQFLQLEFQQAPLGLQFVLREPGSGRWFNYRGGNFYLPIQARAAGATQPDAGEQAALAEEIVRAETTHNSWTLMHRFNLCHELLDRVQGSRDGLALIYVYLRFSALRQLTWQRNYNTKPRELAHAQDRLTQKIAGLYQSEPPSRPLTRLMLATVGRGGEGQRIRDEILNIMHRHHVKEVSGHFLEEWHQKLHNNTTPDDLVICEAYLAFLRSNGNQDLFYRTLESGGVTRQRLESFERPIRSRPDFVPHLKDGLIHDFSQFLRILKASHSGTDLETAVQAARGQLDGGMQGLLNYVWEHRIPQPGQILDLVRQTTDARRRLAERLGRAGSTRELLYLDLALEQLLRAVVEGNIHQRLSGDQLVDLVGCVLENVTLSYDAPELAACARHWARLQALPRFNERWALHAKSVVDRISRALSGWIDRLYQLLQPKAEFLGQGFQAEPWTITLFSEEVVRGSSLGFVLSMLLRHLEPVLRKAAHLGDWQVISPGQGLGRLEVVEALGSIQGKRFEAPTVVVADQVTGAEEIPENITAVIAPDVVDIVSHVAVRARNAHVLFVTCHDADRLQQLKSLQGHQVRLEVSPAGDVQALETTAERGASAGAEPSAGKRGKARAPEIQRPALKVTPRAFTRYAVPSSQFSDQLVGGKAWHMAQLRGRLPDWIRLPASAALPFGVLEQVLGLPQNHAVAQRYGELVSQTAGGDTGPLPALRETVLRLTAPEELKTALREAITAAGLAWPEDWESAWTRIKQVWASKWNERAFLSRRRVGLAHDALVMSVLVQEVVPADYAFVLHTANPSTGKRDELFGEVVLGLGETLVGNYPGRALSFVSNKSTGAQSLLSFPGKSLGLYGEGLIFRSDSNGEDLAGYAGAGLYDSVLLRTPQERALDYTQEALVWDEAFRQNLLASLARIGQEVERACGSPQDIEGAVTQGKYYVVQTRPQVGLGNEA